MYKFKNFLKIATLCSVLISIPGISFATEQTESAENNALRYIVALFSTNMDEVLSTIHPEAIDSLNNEFLAELEQAEQTGHPFSFLTSVGIYASPEEIRAMSKKELFAFLIQSNNNDQPSHMEKVNFKVIDSDLLSNNTALVYMAVGNTDNAFKLEMKLENEKWLVIRSFLEKKQTSI